jgi:DNA polymerase-1
VLEYRQYRARHRTFIDKLVNGYAVEHHGGLYVHPSFHLERVETYRTSSSSPNMQNIPVKDFEHPELSVKRQFVSRFPGGQILNVDQSQVEIRFAAWASGDPRMLAAIGSGEDIHRAMAAQMLGKADPAAVTEQERHECKTRTFLILYGGGARKLAQDLKISDMRARQLINDYFAAFSGLRAYIDQVHTTVKRDLCVQTHFGFVRRFARPTKWRSIDGFSVLRRAFNTMIQNGAACLLYCALLELHSAMQSRKLQSKIILQVHDSILIDVYPGEMEVVAPLAKWAMEEASIKKAREFGVNFALPLRADIQVGPSWGSVEDYKPTVED